MIRKTHSTKLTRQLKFRSEETSQHSIGRHKKVLRTEAVDCETVRTNSKGHGTLIQESVLGAINLH